MKTTNLIILILALIFPEGIFAQDFNLRRFPDDKSPEKIGKKLVEKYLNTAHSRYGNTKPERPPEQITYPDVCTWLGGLWFAKETGDKMLFNGLKERFEPLFDNENHLLPKPNHVDNNVFGALPLEFYMQLKEKKYLDMGILYAETQWQLPKNAKPEEKKYHDKGYSWQTRIWIDDMFMITAVQAQAYRVTKKMKYIERAAKEMILYLDTIQLKNGLFYHSPEAHYSWGRGNGWMAVGMAELLRILPKKSLYHQRIMDGYKLMMASLLNYQAEDGMWRQIIDDPESWKETSCTAMFTYAMITGVKNGWLDKKTYGSAAKKSWIKLLDYLNKDYELTEVCAGTNIMNNREHYMNRPRITGDLHGQAPLIWCAAALMRN